MENIVKRIHIEITSTPFSILRNEIYKVLDCSSDGKEHVLGRDNAPNIHDVKMNLEDGWSAFYVDSKYHAAYGEKSIFSAPELIDALYQLLIWYLKNNYIETKKD